MVPTKPGLREFRYTLPTTPVATASVDIGHVGVRFDLYLHGELDISVARRHGADDRAVRACTLKALRAMVKGPMVKGSGSYSPTITSAAGHVFSQTGYRFTEPNTMTFAGSCAINFAQPCDCGTVSVAGEARYELDVTALPADGRAVESIGSGQAGAWFVRHEPELASIGVVVLVAVPIAPGQLVSASPAAEERVPEH
jgi:hypothetical protein